MSTRWFLIMSDDIDESAFTGIRELTIEGLTNGGCASNDRLPIIRQTKDFFNLFKMLKCHKQGILFI